MLSSVAHVTLRKIKSVSNMKKTCFSRLCRKMLKTFYIRGSKGGQPPPDNHKEYRVS